MFPLVTQLLDHTEKKSILKEGLVAELFWTMSKGVCFSLIYAA